MQTQTQEEKKTVQPLQVHEESALPKKKEAPPKQETKKPKHTFLYMLVMCIYAVLAKVIFRMRIVGKENFPQEENYIIMGNHVAFWDPLTLALCNLKREIHFMGKKELFKNPILGWVWTKVHAFPVDRGNLDMAAMRTAMKIVKSGETLGIFPEGTRSHTDEMLPLLSGASVLALKSGVQVIPVYINGRYKPFRPMRVVVGSAVPIDDLRAQGVDKDSCDAFTVRMETAFAQLKEQSEKK